MTGELSLRRLDSFEVREVIWLERPFWQRGAFHLLAGRKGVTKGTLLAGLAARTTSGELYGEPKRVFIVTSEDSIELDFKPRLLAAGGEETLVEIVNDGFLLPGDLSWLEQVARERGDVGLIVIDPVGNHLGGIDTDKEGLVRAAIQGLNRLADEVDCIVTGVRHLGKDASRGALASVLGSTAWVDVPRCVILMAADDEDPFLFHAQVVAGNRGPKNRGQAFRLHLVDVPPAREITLLLAEGESRKDVEQLLRTTGNVASASRSDAARELILAKLEAAPEMESDELDAEIARQTGLAAKTVRNVRSNLAKNGLIKPYPERDENGIPVRWLVRRTNAPRQIPTPQTYPAQPSQIPTTSLERINRGPGRLDPDFPERESGRELDHEEQRA